MNLQIATVLQDGFSLEIVQSQPERNKLLSKSLYGIAPRLKVNSSSKADGFVSKKEKWRVISGRDLQLLKSYGALLNIFISSRLTPN